MTLCFPSQITLYIFAAQLGSRRSIGKDKYFSKRWNPPSQPPPPPAPADSQVWNGSVIPPYYRSNIQHVLGKLYLMSKKKNERPGENCMWWNHITASLTAVCWPSVPVYIGMQEHVYWICNQKQKREEWQGKLLPAATLYAYLCRFSLLLNWACLQTLMSSPSYWWFFKHAMVFV